MMSEAVQGKVGTVYYCPIDKSTYQIIDKNKSQLVTDPQKIENARDVRIDNWRQFSVANGGGDKPPQVSALAKPPSAVPAGSTSSSSPDPINGGSTSASGLRKPKGMPADLWQYCVDAGQKFHVDPYILAAQMERESQFGKGLHGSPSAGDGLMQVEPGTRGAYAGEFRQQTGHAYDNNNPKDQVLLAALILSDKGGDSRNELEKYNGGDDWKPGDKDSYGRVIQAGQYASAVLERAQQMKDGG
jgi:soluble lytic murein transglycosylase-like protein